MTDTITPTDWRSIDTATNEGRRALDVEIARRLGKNAVQATNEREWQFDQNREWVSEYYVEDYMIYEVPYYTSDLNIAWSLWDGFPFILKVKRTPNNLFYVEPDIMGSVTAVDGTLALALCRAWLYWKDKPD